MTTTLTQTDAEQRVPEYAEEIRAEFGAAARLHIVIDRLSDCADPTDDGPRDRVVVSQTSRVLDVESSRYDEVLDAVRDRWVAAGRTVLDDSTVSAAQRFLWLENPADGFRISLQTNDSGQLTLVVTSPCVWPSS